MNILVTCIYNNLANTKFGGRNCRDERYRDSLLTISKTNEQIICFTNDYSHQNLITFFSERNVNNITFINLDLSNLPFHNDIQRIKQLFPDKFNDLFWHQRCVELMWGKLFMLDYVINHYECDNVFWIDAGLCHNDVISPKYSLKSDLDKNITSNPYQLMNERFVRNINNFIGNKILAIRSTVPHNTPIPEKYNIKPYENTYGVVGGLFGGNKNDMKFVIKEFFDKVDQIIANDELYGEENILSAILNDHPHLFKTFDFESWYHEGWADWRDPSKITFSDFFDEITNSNNYEDGLLLVTLAIGEQYRNISHSLIDTYFKFVDSDIKLFILTDIVEEYSNYDQSRVIIQRIDSIPNDSPTFAYNLKYKAIKRAHEEFPLLDKIFYLDADCYFTNYVTKNDFEELNHGINVVLGSHASTILNPQMKIKLYDIAKNPEELDIYTFRECTLLFKIENKFLFRNFLIEWGFIFDEIVEKKLVHVGECTDIYISAIRSQLPINDLFKSSLYKVRESLYTTIQASPVRAIL